MRSWMGFTKFGVVLIQFIITYFIIQTLWWMKTKKYHIQKNAIHLTCNNIYHEYKFRHRLLHILIRIFVVWRHAGMTALTCHESAYPATIQHCPTAKSSALHISEYIYGKFHWTIYQMMQLTESLWYSSSLVLIDPLAMVVFILFPTSKRDIYSNAMQTILIYWDLSFLINAINCDKSFPLHIKLRSQMR